MPDDLELRERKALRDQQERADQAARGSRAGTSTVAGQNVAGVVLAETSIKYGATYSVGEDGAVTVEMDLGMGMGGLGEDFGLG